MALVQLTTTEEFEEINQAKKRRQEKKADSSAANQKQKKTGKRKLKFVSDSNVLNVHQIDEVVSRGVVSEMTDQSERLHPKIRSSSRDQLTKNKEAKFNQPLKQPCEIEPRQLQQHKGSIKGTFKKRESVFGQVQDQNKQRNMFPIIQTQLKVLSNQNKQETFSQDGDKNQQGNHNLLQVKTNKQPTKPLALSPQGSKQLPSDEGFKSMFRSTQGRKSIVCQTQGSLIGEINGDSPNTKSLKKTKNSVLYGQEINHINKTDTLTDNKPREIGDISHLEVRSADSLLNSRVDLKDKKNQGLQPIHHDDQNNRSLNSTIPFNDHYLSKEEQQLQKQETQKLAKVDKMIGSIVKQQPQTSIRTRNLNEALQDLILEKSTPAEESETAKPRNQSSLEGLSSVGNLYKTSGGLTGNSKDSKQNQRHFDQKKQSMQVRKGLMSPLYIQRRSELAVIRSQNLSKAPRSSTQMRLPISEEIINQGINLVNKQANVNFHSQSTTLRSLNNVVPDPSHLDKVQLYKLQNQQHLNSKSKSRDVYEYEKFQNIIDYPRYIRFSSQFESVSNIQMEMRRQRIFHKEFCPTFCSDKNQAILEGVYVPNKPVFKDKEDMYVNEFIRANGNLQAEPAPKPKSQLMKVYGKPTLKDESLNHRQRKIVMGPGGHELNEDELTKRKLAFKNMMNYSRNLVIDNRMQLNLDQHHQIKFKQQQKLNDLVSMKENPVGGNAKQNFLSQKKAINEKLDDGFVIDIPERAKWHPSQKEDFEFVNKINTTSMESMIYSFKKLLKPREHRVNNATSRLYDDTIRLPGDNTVTKQIRQRKANSVNPNWQESHHNSTLSEKQPPKTSDPSQGERSRMPYSQTKLMSMRLVPHNLSSRGGIKADMMNTTPNFFNGTQNSTEDSTMLHSAQGLFSRALSPQNNGSLFFNKKDSRIQGFHDDMNTKSSARQNNVHETISLRDIKGPEEE